MGAVIGLLGRNGAGKTTTVECLQGLRRVDGGRVLVLGLDPQRHTQQLRRRIGSNLPELVVLSGLFAAAVALTASTNTEAAPSLATLRCRPA